ENDALRRQLDSADDPNLIEEIARDDGMVKPGEKVFYDVSN
ncbi:MAG: septum formation initiator family protein, partial [Oscillospiraceae bacterium]|nr:septum formation initiator family protein [Oscillospiraceae bacterium]